MSAFAMSHGILKRLRSLNRRLGSELSDAPNLEVNTEEYKLKQKLIFATDAELESTRERIQQLKEEWDLADDAGPLSPVHESMNTRDWEERITNQPLTPIPVQPGGTLPNPPSSSQPVAGGSGGGGGGTQEQNDELPGA